MNALMIVDLTPLDKEILSVYSAAAVETLIPFEGEFIAKGPIHTLHGDSPFSTKVVIQFPTREKQKYGTTQVPTEPLFLPERKVWIVNFA